MKLKKSFLILWLAIVTIALFSCNNNIAEVDGVIYEKDTESINDYYAVISLSESSYEKACIYIKDEVNGIPVSYVGTPTYISHAFFESDNLEKLYFPWSIEVSRGEKDQNSIRLTERHIKYIFSPSVNVIVCKKTTV